MVSVPTPAPTPAPPRPAALVWAAVRSVLADCAGAELPADIWSIDPERWMLAGRTWQAAILPGDVLVGRVPVGGGEEPIGVVVAGAPRWLALTAKDGALHTVTTMQLRERVVAVYRYKRGTGGRPAGEVAR